MVNKLDHEKHSLLSRIMQIKIIHFSNDNQIYIRTLEIINKLKNEPIPVATIISKDDQVLTISSQCTHKKI